MAVTVKTAEDKRDLTQAMLRGVACKCPACGEGKLFRAYLKTNDACPACGEVLKHHRADDLPPYIAIVIVGHILVGIMLHVDMFFSVSAATYLAVLLPLAIVMPLAMLPSIKGGVVGLQWALRMHGFDPNHKEDAAEGR